MRKLMATLQMTIDGVGEWPASREAESGEDSDFWESTYARHADSIDTLLLGRRAYEKWASFWPQVRTQADAGRYMRQFSEFTERVEKVVFSRTLSSASWERSRLVRGDPAGEIERIRSRPGGNILIGGGPRLVQEFLRLGLVDELRLVIYPSLAGRGKPMFHVEQLPDNPDDMIPFGAPSRHDFRLVEARPIRSGDGAVFLEYVAVRDGSGTELAR